MDLILAAGRWGVNNLNLVRKRPDRLDASRNLEGNAQHSAGAGAFEGASESEERVHNGLHRECLWERVK